MLLIFSTPALIRHLWQLKAVVCLHCCLMCAVLLSWLPHTVKNERAEKASLDQVPAYLFGVTKKVIKHWHQADPGQEAGSRFQAKCFHLVQGVAGKRLTISTLRRWIELIQLPFGNWPSNLRCAVGISNCLSTTELLAHMLKTSYDKYFVLSTLLINWRGI
jgi:hypothetical protein